MRVQISSGLPMFEKYEIVNENNDHYTVEITDSTFVQEIVVRKTPGGINIMSPLITIYENKELNVAANITKAYVYLCKRFHQDPKVFLGNMILVNKDVAKYKDDIQKYLALM
jgi:hypothetical protein